MAVGTVFVNNRSQAVRIPMDVRLPEGVHKVEIRAKGNRGQLLFGWPRGQ